jgi:ABC-2 type transport system permease protein
LGILLLGGLLMSLGCLASALTHSQILAAMLTLTAGFTLFLLSFFAEQLTASSTWQAEVLSHLALIDQMNDFARGLIDTRYVVLLVSLAFIGLFLTLRALETRRWK